MRPMTKAYKSGEITGQVVTCTKESDPSLMIVLPDKERRSLVVVGNPYKFDVGNRLTIKFNPNSLYPTTRKKGFWNWMVDIQNVKSIHYEHAC